MLTILALCSVLAAPVMQPLVPDGPVYLAQADVPATPAAIPDDVKPDEILAWVRVAIDAFRDHNWPLAVGALAMILIGLLTALNIALRKFEVGKPETRDEILLWSAAGGGCLLLFGKTLIAGGGWGDALLQGLVTGAAAIGFYQLVFVRLLKPLIERWSAKKPAP